MNRLKHHFILIMMVLLSCIIWLQMLIYIIHEIFNYNLFFGFLQYCLSAIQEDKILHQIVLIGLYGLIIYSFGMLLLRLIQQIILVEKWSKKVNEVRDNQLSAHINSLNPQCYNRIVVIKHNAFLAMTSGFIKPKIFISDSLISELSKGELLALLLHEYAHCRNYDPLRLLLIRLIKDSLPFVPVLKRVYHFLQVWMELLADQYVINRMKTPYDLANVILKCSKFEKNIAANIGFADLEINYRIKQLIEPHSKVTVPLLERRTIMISSGVFFIISMIVTSGCS